MKKALVILLTLAVAGGLFAQTLTWGGGFEGGVGMLQKDGGDAVFGAVAPSNWVNGVRAQLQLSYANSDANAGFRIRFRANGTGDIFNNDNPFLHQAWAWAKPFGNMVEFRGGRIHDDVLATQDPIFGTYLLNSYGLVAYIRPMDMLTIGLGGYTPNNLSPGADWDAGGLGLWAGLGLNFGIAEIRAQFRTAGTGTDALAGIRIGALDFLPINAVVRAMNLQDFADAGRLDAHVFVGLGLVDGLGITLGAAFSNNNARDDLYMAFGGWLTYAIGNIVPRVDLWYVSGGQYVETYGFNATGSNIDYGAMTWNADDVYFSIRPAVQFRATAATWWELGAVINMNLGDSRDGMDLGVFTAVRVSF